MFGWFRRWREGRPGEVHRAAPDALWRESMERSRDGLMIVRAPRQILHVNRVAATLLGRSAHELENTAFAHQLTLEGLSRIIVPHGGNEPTTLEASAVVIEWEGAPAWLVTLRDVSAPHRQQSLKEERIKVLERLAQGAALADVLTALVQFVESQYPQSICSVMLLDPDGLRLRYCASTRLPRDLIDAADGIVIGPGQGTSGTAAHERRVVIVTDIAIDPLWVGARDVALENGIHACWSMPVFSSSGEVIGTFTSYYRTPRGPVTDEIELVGACAQIIAVAIERHRAEAQLKLLESSIAHLNDMVIITDAWPIDEPGPRMVFVNEAVLRHSGYSREELLGKSPRLLQGPLTDRGELGRIRTALAARQPVRAEVINYTRAGEPFWVELDITSINDEHGRATHFVSVQRDISEYKRIQQAMQRSEERFRLVARVTTDAIWDWDLQTGALWWSDGVKGMFGYEVDELGGNIDAWAKLLHPDDHHRVVDGVQALIDSGGQSWYDEYRFLRRDGSYAHVADRGFVSHDENGRPVRMVGGITDVSERHAAEADARRTAHTQSLIVRAQRQIAESELDPDGIMQLIVQRAQELVGAGGAAIVSVDGDALCYQAVSGSSFHHRGLRFSRAQSLAGAAIRAREAQICDDADTDPRVDRVACRKVGARSLMCVPLNRMDIESALLSVVSSRPHAFDGRDLANLQILADSLGSALQRERDADQLRRSEANYRLLFEGNPQPMLVYDVLDLRFLAVNPAAIALYGYTHEEFLGMGVRDLPVPAQLPRLDRQLAQPMPGSRDAAPWRHRRKDGRTIEVQISGDRMLFEGGQACLLLVVDITQRLQSERRLARITRARLMLSRCNEALVRAITEQALLDAVCRIGVETGGYRMAWTGLAMDDDEKSIAHAACAGEGLEYLQGLRLSWAADRLEGSGPSGQTIRGGEAVVVEDIASAADFAPWVAEALQHGFKASLSLPLRGNGRTFGHLSFYSAVARPIATEELKLLQEMADNLAYGIEHLRSRVEREQLQIEVTRVATSVAFGSGASFFAQLVQALADAVGADAGFIARMPPTTGEPASVIAGVVDGRSLPAFRFALAGTPVDHLDSDEVRVIADHLDRQSFAGLAQLGLEQIEAYVGRRLDGANGTPLGVLFLLFRKPVRRSDFVISAMSIFAIRAAAELEQQTAYARIRDQASLLDKTRDAILAGDLDHRITYWNKGAERLYGWTAEEILGVSNIEDVYPDPGIVQEILASLLDTDEWNGRLQQRRKDGRIIEVEAHSTLIRDDDGNPRFFLVVASEVDPRWASR